MTSTTVTEAPPTTSNTTNVNDVNCDYGNDDGISNANDDGVNEYLDAGSDPDH